MEYQCYFCGTEIQDGLCIECNDTAEEMGLDFNELMEAI